MSAPVEPVQQQPPDNISQFPVRQQSNGRWMLYLAIALAATAVFAWFIGELFSEIEREPAPRRKSNASRRRPPTRQPEARDDNDDDDDDEDDDDDDGDENLPPASHHKPGRRRPAVVIHNHPSGGTQNAPSNKGAES